MEHTNTKLRYNGLYLFYYGTMGVFFPYIATYLEKVRNLSGTQIGLITMVSLLLGVLFMPAWGIVADKIQRFKILFLLGMAGSIVATYLYYRSLTFMSIMLSALLLELMRNGPTPILDTMTTTYCSQTKTNFGAIRSYGSLGYLVMSIITGIVSQLFSLDLALFATYGALLFISFLIMTTINDRPAATTERVPIMVNLGKLFKDRRFIVVNLVNITGWCVVTASNTFAGNHLTVTLGAPISSISWFNLFMVLPEIVFLHFVARFARKTGLKKYYLFATIVTIARFAIYFFSSNEYFFIAASIVHCFAVGYFTVINLIYIQGSFDGAVLGSAIVILNFSVSFFKAIYSYLMGFVYQHLGSNIMFGLCLVPLLVSLLIILKTDIFDEFSLIE